MIVFDHHETKNRDPKRLKIIDSKATSCCEIIFETVQDVRKKYLTPEVATCFYL
jgi:nanoRNase/pAp phosphatase (c-di-AMP/oligoRNAs hydrolase)